MLRRPMILRSSISISANGAQLRITGALPISQLTNMMPPTPRTPPGAIGGMPISR
jgi:hypothetical protein